MFEEIVFNYLFGEELRKFERDLKELEFLLKLSLFFFALAFYFWMF